jgi:hypothetical protein
MMKKVMFVVVSLLLVSYCFALESAPSNKVGYVKLTVAGGTGNVYSTFGLPFVFWDVPTGNVPTYGTESRKPSDIFGTQPLCGTSLSADRVVRSDVGRFAYRGSPSCAWTSTLETNAADAEPGHGYQIRTTNQPVKYYVLAGEADTTAIGIPGVPINPNTFVSYSWRDPRELAVNRLNLLAQGFTGGTLSTNSDRVALIGGNGAFAWYRTSDHTWQGSLTTVTPGKSYYIASKHSPAWTYTYNASGAAVSMPTKGEVSNTMKMAPVAKTTKAAVKTTSSKN